MRLHGRVEVPEVFPHPHEGFLHFLPRVGTVGHPPGEGGGGGEGSCSHGVGGFVEKGHELVHRP
jgi:hypothetical protein